MLPSTGWSAEKKGSLGSGLWINIQSNVAFTGEASTVLTALCKREHIWLIWCKEEFLFFPLFLFLCGPDKKRKTMQKKCNKEKIKNKKDFIASLLIYEV